MKQSEKVKLLEEKVGNLESSLEVLMNLNHEQMQVIAFQLQRMEKDLSKLLFKQI